MREKISKETEAFIVKNYLKYPSRAMAKKLGVSRATVLKYIKKNKLSVPETLLTEWRKRIPIPRPFTQKENDYLINNIAEISIKKMSRNLKRCSASVARQCRLLGLGSIIDKKVAENLFRKGMAPSTKGKKQTDYMTAEAIERTKATRFKKNHKPHNTREIGAIVKNVYGYNRIKIAHPNKWDFLHRHIWKQHYGPIPDTNIIRFKDSNPDNCILQNLEMVTLEDHMKLNNIYQYPIELQQTIKILNKLKRKLHGKK